MPGDQQSRVRGNLQLPQCLHRREAGDREPASNYRAHSGRPMGDVARVDQYLLGPEATAARQWRLVHENVIASRDTADLFADRGDDASALDAQCRRWPKTDMPPASTHKRVPRPDAGCLNLDQQFARTWTGGFRQLEQLRRLTHRPDPAPSHHLTLTPSCPSRGSAIDEFWQAGPSHMQVDSGRPGRP